jgi:hypothetical protein
MMALENFVPNICVKKQLELEVKNNGGNPIVYNRSDLALAFLRQNLSGLTLSKEDMIKKLVDLGLINKGIFGKIKAELMFKSYSYYGCHTCSFYKLVDQQEKIYYQFATRA